MTWNHRIIRSLAVDGSDWLGIHEVYYDEAGRPAGYTADPVGVCGENIEDLRICLKQMARALEMPVLSDADFDRAKAARKASGE